MADHKCYRCAYHSNVGPRDVRERVRCYPLMKDGGPLPFWAAMLDVGERLPYYRDLDGGVVRLSEDCARFKEVVVRRVPVQGDPLKKGRPSRVAGTITWAEHLEAYIAYSERFVTSQSAEDVVARGGFGYDELSVYLGRSPSTWEPRR